MVPLSQFERRSPNGTALHVPGRACRRLDRPNPIAASTFPSLHPGLWNRNCGLDGARMAGGWRLPQSVGSRVVTLLPSGAEIPARRSPSALGVIRADLDVSSLQLTRRSVLVERADRRGFSHIMH